MSVSSNGYPRFSLEDGLTADQVEFFNTHGFLHFTGFIDAARVQELIQASLQVQDKWLAEGVQKVNGVPIRYGRNLDGRPLVQRFAFANQHSPVLARFLEDPRFNALLPLIGAADARIGKDEKDGMVINHYVHGPDSAYSRLGWHTDGLRDIFLGTRLNPLLNVGVHLSDLGVEHGGLRIIPGTHRQGLLQMLFRKRYFMDHEDDPQQLAIIPAAGDLTVHDGRLWHRVAQSQVSGEASRRRVIYIPLISGKYAPKSEHSPTPLYQRFSSLMK
jgi:phytanoyl-CoA hydroxylase